MQEPGANDNASGCGTLLAAALAMQDAIRRGALPAPARTITFLWVDEIRGSEQWVKDHADRVKGVVAMLSLDMTGEDTAKTGGTFLIEKEPDPSAMWDRPSDPHSEWGAGKVDPATVRGSFLNDLHLAVALRRARDTGWVVRTNPYEGGSDHTVFTRAGVPALLNWHFTDRYYHTNLDTIDKISAAEMQHVAIVVGTTALFLASADKTDVAAMTRLMETARDARLATERTQQRHARDSPGVAQMVRRSDGERQPAVRTLIGRWPRGRPVHLRHVLLDHAARREARHVRAHRLAHDGDPAARQAAAATIAIVERRHDLVLEQLVERVGVGGVGRGVIVGIGVAFDQPAVAAVEAFRPPAVADAQVRHAVERRLHAAGAAGFERLARVVEPHVAALHQVVRDVHVVVVDEGEPAAELRIERVLEDALQVVLGRLVGRDAPCRRTRSAPADRSSLRMRASRSGSWKISSGRL